MKKVIKAYSLIFIYSILIFLFSSCGGGVDSIVVNKYFGDLPSIASNYLVKIDAKKEAIKKNTDGDKVFKLDKELKLLKNEAENSIEDYIVNNPISKLPFELKVDAPFTIKDVSVYQKYSSTPSSLWISVKVIMTKNVSKRMSLFIKAVDKDGNQISKKIGVIGTNTFSKKSYKVDQEVELIGEIKRTADLINFEKFVFVSREEYNKLK